MPSRPGPRRGYPWSAFVRGRRPPRRPGRTGVRRRGRRSRGRGHGCKVMRRRRRRRRRCGRFAVRSASSLPSCVPGPSMVEGEEWAGKGRGAAGQARRRVLVVRDARRAGPLLPACAVSGVLCFLEVYGPQERRHRRRRRRHRRRRRGVVAAAARRSPSSTSTSTSSSLRMLCSSRASSGACGGAAIVRGGPPWSERLPKSQSGVLSESGRSVLQGLGLQGPAPGPGAEHQPPMSGGR